jgi:hypothetical protein
VFAALAGSHWIEDITGWSINKFVRTARRCRTVEIQTGAHTSPPPTRDRRPPHSLASTHGDPEAAH